MNWTIIHQTTNEFEKYMDWTIINQPIKNIHYPSVENFWKNQIHKCVILIE